MPTIYKLACWFSFDAAEGEELTSEGEENGEMQDNNEEAALPNGSVEENDDSSGSSFEELQHWITWLHDLSVSNGFIPDPIQSSYLPYSTHHS